MTDFIRKTMRFTCSGVSLNAPVDSPSLVARGKYPILTNLRVYEDGQIDCRKGLTKLGTLALAGVVHSIRRLNDVQAATWTRIAGAGTSLAFGQGNLTSAATGFSGDPLALVPFQPDEAPNPWMYVGDRTKMAKINVSGTARSVGIMPPISEPTAALGNPATLDVDTFQATTNWSADNTILDNTGLSIVARINTTVTAAIGDVTGGGAGWYTITPAAMDGILPGTFVTFGTTGGSNKMVQTVRNAPFTTTVAAITYDSGTTGACSIQPTAAVDIEVDSMVQLNAAEYVRVTSVTDAPDGTVQSFRCVTVGTIAAGQAIAGVASFRCYCDAAPSGTVVRNAMEVKFLTNTSGGVGYITKTAGLANSNLGVISSRQVGDEDEFVCSLKMSNLSELVEGKLMIDVDGTDTTFTQNAYVWNFRASDFQKTVTNAQTVIGASTSASVNNAVSGSGSGAGSPDPSNGPGAGKENVAFILAGDVSGNVDQTDASTGASGGPVVQASFDSLGQAQWMTMRFKFKDATRVGTAAGRSLQTVTGIRVQLTVSACVNTETVDFDSWFVSGTFGPDVGDIGTPYCYLVRGRDTTTGARSTGGPAIRPGGGISPHRQSVTVSFANMPTATDPSWAGVNTIDVYRFGGSLNDWRFMGTVANDPTVSNTLSFTDIYPDDWAFTQPLLEQDQDKPFPVQDKPRSGTCNVSGTTVTWVSGDTFNTSWAIGTVIQIGVGTSAVTYTTHNRPTTTTKLEIEQNGGSQAAVPFTITSPIILGQPLPCLWGPIEGFTLACGDPLNPGRLYWMNGNNPDASAQGNWLDITSPSEPLMNGCMWDGRAFVWSTERMFAIYPTFEGAFIATGQGQVVGGGAINPLLAVPFRALEVPNGVGLAVRWGLCVGPAMWFIGKDGIYTTTGGAPQSISDADLMPWLPYEGNAGVAVNGYFSPDFGYTNGSTQAKDFRLAWYDDYVYFHYRNTEGQLGCFVFDTVRQGWFPDAYGRTVVMHYGEEGPKDSFVTFPGAAINVLLAGGSDGSGNATIFQVSGATDDTLPISFHARTPSIDADEAWLGKLWGDAMLDINPSNNSITVTPGYDNYVTLVAATTVTGASRDQSIIPTNSGAGQIARNLALDIAWTGVGTVLYLWEPTLWPHSYLQKNWVTPDKADGLYGFGHLRDGYIAHISTADLVLTINIEGIDYLYIIPNGGGAYRRTYVVLQPVKGKARHFQLSSAQPCRVLTADTKFNLKEWSSQGPYTPVAPFGEAWPS